MGRHKTTSNQAPHNNGDMIAPPTLTPRQAAFVKHYLTGMGAVKAAEAAGYSSKNSHNASWRLLRRPAVVAAISESHAALREEGEVTAKSMYTQLARDRELAIQLKQLNAAVRASEIQSKLMGLLVDKVEGNARHGITVQVVKFGDTVEPPLLESKAVSDD
jgi:phage terminase small subunit